MSEHFKKYISQLEKTSPDAAVSVNETVKAIVPKHISNFSYKEHLTGLLLGNVQSGKTGQMFGIISAAADEGFELFVLLVTDNVYLHAQTFKRAIGSLDTFTVCNESDEMRFTQSDMRKPVLIILKKIQKFLKLGGTI